MSPRSVEENSRIRQESADHLVESALLVFAERGLHGASMSEIAKQAGVAKGLAYHYFANKKALLVAIAERRLSEWLPLVEGLEARCEASERFCFVVEFVLGELLERPAALRFFNSLYLSQEGTAAIDEAMRLYADQFDRLARAEIKLMRDLGRRPAELEAIFLRSTLQGICLEYLLAPKSYPLVEVKQMLKGRYLHG